MAPTTQCCAEVGDTFRLCKHKASITEVDPSTKTTRRWCALHAPSRKAERLRRKLGPLAEPAPVIALRPHARDVAARLRGLAAEIERGEVRAFALVSVDHESSLDLWATLLHSARENDRLLIGAGFDRMKQRLAEEYWDRPK